MESILYEECDSAANLRPKRSPVRTKLSSTPIFRGFSLNNDTEKLLDNPQKFRAVIRVLLRQKEADVSILNELNKELSKVLLNHTEPNLRLGYIFHRAVCFDNSSIRLTLPLLMPEELLIWKCEDIGVIQDGSYEFYKLIPSWMVEDEEGRTFKINLNECVKNRFNQTFCQTGAKVFYDAKCSINNVETCSKTYVKPREKHGSYSRTLPDGVSVYGTIHQVSKIRRKNSTTDGKKSRMQPLNYDTPGLFYFSFNTTRSPT